MTRDLNPHRNKVWYKRAVAAGEAKTRLKELRSRLAADEILSDAELAEYRLLWGEYGTFGQ